MANDSLLCFSLKHLAPAIMNSWSDLVQSCEVINDKIMGQILSW